MNDTPTKRSTLGTAQEEFDIATGYWKKWQRCEEEKDALLEALKECREAISAGPFAAASAYQTVLEAIAKAEGKA